MSLTNKNSADESKKWNVLIANAWGGNRGDEAMINTLSRLIREVAPHSNVSAMPFRNEDLDVDSSISVIRNRMADYWYMKMPSAVISLLDYRVPRKVIREAINAAHRLGVLKSSEAVSGHDLIISSPQGPTLGDMYDAKEKIVEPLSFAKSKRIPYMVLAISAGPFDKHTKSKGYVGDVLNSAEKIVVREERSLGYLMAEYPHLNNVEAAIDIVYAAKWSLKNKSQALVDSYRAFISSVKTGSIGACISLTPARNPKNIFNREEYIEKFVELVDHALTKVDNDFILFPHLIFDMPALEEIKNKVKFGSRVKILPPVFDSDFQRDAISKLSFFISSRYHPTIFSIQARVPFMCIKNQFKVEGMMERIGIQDAPSCWQDESASKFIDTFDLGWSSLNELRRKTEDAADEAEKIASVYKNIIHDAYSNWRQTKGN